MEGETAKYGEDKRKMQNISKTCCIQMPSRFGCVFTPVNAHSTEAGARAESFREDGGEGERRNRRRES